MLKLSDLDKVMKETINAVDKGKTDIFEMAENARNQLARVEKMLLEIKKETREVIEEVDLAESEEYKARQHLVHVSKNFKIFNDEDVRKAYEDASQKQVKTALLRQKEKTLKERRTELEISYRQLLESVASAENLVSRLGVAMDYLGKNIRNICDTLEEMESRNLAGLHIIMAQEEERRRIAREIHDGPAQSVANIILRAEYCQKLFELKPENLVAELDGLKALARTNLKDIRKIIYDLRPMDLDDLGLIPALERYAEEFQKETGMEVNFKFLDEQRTLDTSFQVGCFRIAQEFLNNVRKHSEASAVNMLIEITPLVINLKIADNGIGFNLDEAYQKGTYGLKTMKERAELLKGEIKFNSALGSGTELLLTIPYNREGY